MAWEAEDLLVLDRRAGPFEQVESVGAFGLGQATIPRSIENSLSALIDQVRHGETVLILDRGRPVARLASVLSEESETPAGRVERLERQGLLRRARASKSPDLFKRPRPRAKAGTSVVEALLEDRRGER